MATTNRAPGGLRIEVLVFAVFAALTVLMTWPWAAHLRDAVSDGGDPYLNSWIMYWDFHQTFHDPFHLFDGNVFFPYKYSLAFSEHNYGIALLFFPFYALGLRPLTAHGLAILIGFAFSGYGAFRLTRTLTGRTDAAWIAGLAFAFVPYRFLHISHVNYLFSGWIPVLLEALVLHLRAPSWRRAVWLGAAFLMNALTCIHWFVLTLLPLALSSAVLSFRYGRATRGAYLKAAATVGVALVLLLPFLLPYQRAANLYGFVRSAAEARDYSAHLADWMTADVRNQLWRGLGVFPPHGERALFPGVALLALPLAALLLFGTSRGPREERGIPMLVATIWVVLGFLGSFGMNGPFHRLLYEHVFLFRSIRVPARWAMVCNLGLAVLAGIGAALLADALVRALPRLRFLRPGALALIGLAILWEDRVVPWQVLHGDVDPDPVTLRLKATAMRGGILELPAGSLRGNYRYVLRAADHLKPLVDGVSGFVPKMTRQLQDVTQRRPIPDPLMDRLERIPVSYIVVHESWLEPDDRAALHDFLARHVAAGRIRFLTRFTTPAKDDLYAVVKVEPDAGAAAPLLWTPPDSVPAAKRERENALLAGSVDDPAEGITVTSRELLVRGWARAPGEDLDVTILVDGELRPGAISRAPRPDVGNALPQLGDTSRAGYEARYPFAEDDRGPHEIVVLFRKKDGTTRHYPARRFVWSPGP